MSDVFGQRMVVLFSVARRKRGCTVGRDWAEGVEKRLEFIGLYQSTVLNFSTVRHEHDKFPLSPTPAFFLSIALWTLTSFRDISSLEYLRS